MITFSKINSWFTDSQASADSLYRKTPNFTFMKYTKATMNRLRMFTTELFTWSVISSTDQVSFPIK